MENSYAMFQMGLPNRVPWVHTCPCGLRANVPKACQLLVFTCQCANVPKTCWFFNLACQRSKVCQFFKLACQHGKGVPFCSTSRAKRCANFSTIFQKNYIFYLQNISVPNIFIYFVHLNYIPSIYILYIFFYLNLYTVCKKPMVQKYTSCKLITKLLCRSSRSQMCFKIGFLTNFEIFIGKHLYWILFLINLQATLLKRDSDTGVFLWILWNSKNCFFTEHLRWLLLYLRHYSTQKLSQKKRKET